MLQDPSDVEISRLKTCQTKVAKEKILLVRVFETLQAYFLAAYF